MTQDTSQYPLAAEENEQALQAGEILNNGQFKVTKYLASGGFGMTYLAKDSLDRDVVVKECFPSVLCRREGAFVVPANAAASEQFQSIVRLFVREAKAMARLVHPNVVGIHQIFEDNGTAYMALDFIDGCDLLDVIEEKSLEISPDRLVLWLRKLLTAVEFIHGHDVLHRDISPDNILVDRHDNPVLIDFGAAREHATRSTRALTTLRVVKDGYSPQEFYIEGGTQNRSSDLYALGATFYHLMTGVAPPNAQERIAAVAERREDPYVPLAGRIEGYPDAFLEPIDRALNILPADRLRCAREWIELIDAAGPFVQPEPFGFDFDAIRNDVARIAEEFEDVPDATDQTPQTAATIESDEVSEHADETLQTADIVPLRTHWSKHKLTIAASFGAAVFLGGSVLLSGFVGQSQTAAVAVMAPDAKPDAFSGPGRIAATHHPVFEVHP